MPYKFSMDVLELPTTLVDKEAVTELETRIKLERTSAGEQTLYFAGVFLALCGRPDKGRDYFNRMAKIKDGKSLDVSFL